MCPPSSSRSNCCTQSSSTYTCYSYTDPCTCLPTWHCVKTSPVYCPPPKPVCPPPKPSYCPLPRPYCPPPRVTTTYTSTTYCSPVTSTGSNYNSYESALNRSYSAKNLSSNNKRSDGHCCDDCADKANAGSHSHSDSHANNNSDVVSAGSNSKPEVKYSKNSTGGYDIHVELDKPWDTIEIKHTETRPVSANSDVKIEVEIKEEEQPKPSYSSSSRSRASSSACNDFSYSVYTYTSNGC